MKQTDEYNQGWGTWAAYFGFFPQQSGHYSHYTLPSSWENGWLTQVQPARGVFVASAWFTPEETLDYTLNTGRPFLLVLCVDCGDITITQRGAAARRLTPFTHLIRCMGGSLRITFPAGVHACFTSLLIFEDRIEHFLSSSGFNYLSVYRTQKAGNPPI